MRATPEIRAWGRQLMLLAALAPAAAAADEPAATPDPPAYTAGEVVVTGSRYTLPERGGMVTRWPMALRDTPASVAVVPGALVAAQHREVLGEALANVSGVNVQSGFGVSDYFVVRGFDSLSSGMVLYDGAVEPEVSFYPMYNVSRIEVLKGPGAFLYGGKPLSGAVNVVRRKPVFGGGPFAVLGGSYGSHGSYRTTADAGWRRGERVALRVNAMGRGSDNYREDKGYSEWAINPAAAVRFRDRAVIEASAEYIANDYSPDSGLPLLGEDLAPVPRTRSYQAPGDFSEQAILRLRLDGEVKLSDRMTLRDKLYFTNFEWPSAGTLLNGVLPGEDGSLRVLRTQLSLDDRQRFFGNQLEAVMERGRHRLLAGLEVARLTDDFTLDAVLLSMIDLHSPVEPGGGGFSVQSQAAEARATVLAPYVAAQWPITGSLESIAGLRFDRIGYEEEISASERSYGKLSPFLGATWSATEDLRLYASAGRAFAPPSTQVTGEREAEESRQLEAGARRQWLQGRVRASAAAYLLQKENIAIPDGTGIVKENGAQRSRGIELEVAAQPSRRWYFLAAYAFAAAELTAFTELVPTFTGEYVFADRAGNVPAFAPAHILNLWSSARTVLGIEAALGARFVSGQYIAPDNGYRIDPALTVDAALGYRVGGARIRLHLRNLTGAEYETRGFGGTAVIPGDPASFYSSLEWAIQ